MCPSDLLLTRTLMPSAALIRALQCGRETQKGKWTHFVLAFDLITCESLPSLSPFVIDSIRRKRRLTWFFSHARQPHCFASLCFFSLSSYNLQRMSVSEPESSIHSLFSEVEDEHLQDRVRESKQLASGTWNGKFRVWRLA